LRQEQRVEVEKTPSDQVSAPQGGPRLAIQPDKRVCFPEQGRQEVVPEQHAQRHVIGARLALVCAAHGGSDRSPQDADVHRQGGVFRHQREAPSMHQRERNGTIIRAEDGHPAVLPGAPQLPEDLLPCLAGLVPAGQLHPYRDQPDQRDVQLRHECRAWDDDRAAASLHETPLALMPHLRQRGDAVQREKSYLGLRRRDQPPHVRADLVDDDPIRVIAVITYNPFHDRVEVDAQMLAPALGQVARAGYARKKDRDAHCRCTIGYWYFSAYNLSERSSRICVSYWSFHRFLCNHCFLYCRFLHCRFLR
jgi:hypothetical protein